MKTKKGAEKHQEERNLSGKRIGFFGKGGSGKSTAVVLLAQGLVNTGYKVCILDADSTNLGLSKVLGMDQPPEPLMAYYGGTIFSGGRVSCPVDDPSPLAGGMAALEELPPQYYRQTHSGITLLAAGKIGDQGPGAGCDGPVSKIARDFRIRTRGKPPVTLVDFKAGFEEIARGVITSLDWAVMIIDPTLAAIEMACNMQDIVNGIKNGKLPATRHLESPDLIAVANQQYLDTKIRGVMFLLNKIGDMETETYLRAKLAERDIEPAGVIYADPSISASWLKGKPLTADKSQRDISFFIQKLEIAERNANAHSNLNGMEG